MIRVLPQAEAEQAKAEARADFERRLVGAIRALPTKEQMDAWWPVTECSACRGDETTELRCPSSKRPCGHHCNCVMVHDHCHWCGKDWGEGD